MTLQTKLSCPVLKNNKLLWVKPRLPIQSAFAPYPAYAGMDKRQGPKPKRQGTRIEHVHEFGVLPEASSGLSTFCTLVKCTKWQSSGKRAFERILCHAFGSVTKPRSSSSALRLRTSAMSAGSIPPGHLLLKRRLAVLVYPATAGVKHTRGPPRRRR